MFESLGCIVKKLKRVSEAGLNLGHLPSGKWRKLSESEVNMLKKIGTDREGNRNRPRFHQRRTSSANVQRNKKSK